MNAATTPAPVDVRTMTDATLYAIVADLAHPLRAAANEELDAREADGYSRRTAAGGAA